MSCKGLKGRALKRCMKKYESNSKKIFPQFNVATDTTYNVLSSNNPRGIEMSKKSSRRVINEVNKSEDNKIVKSNDPKDTHPYKLKIMRKKDGSKKL
tara:strand:+ start:1745 stop:2035 length:291 start_codon:yes stop_codon:yes gene_type:complete